VISAVGTDTGHELNSVDIERGLRELNSDMHFDLAAKIDQKHPYIGERQGVYYNGNHICSMDRGVSPEFKVWTMVRRPVEVGWSEADKDDVSVQYEEILPATEGYADLRMLAASGRDHSLRIRDDGKLFKLRCMAVRPARDRIIRCGWRHTFEHIIRWGVPNITRENLSAKFGVDMNKYPMGPPEVHEAG
jgi:hypothetical protein